MRFDKSDVWIDFELHFDRPTETGGFLNSSGICAIRGTYPKNQQLLVVDSRSARVAEGPGPAEIGSRATEN